jgi:hypothetical protein
MHSRRVERVCELRPAPYVLYTYTRYTGSPALCTVCYVLCTMHCAVCGVSSASASCCRRRASRGASPRLTSMRPDLFSYLNEKAPRDLYEKAPRGLYEKAPRGAPRKAWSVLCTVRCAARAGAHLHVDFLEALEHLRPPRAVQRVYASAPAGDARETKPTHTHTHRDTQRHTHEDTHTHTQSGDARETKPALSPPG